MFASLGDVRKAKSFDCCAGASKVIRSPMPPFGNIPYSERYVWKYIKELCTLIQLLFPFMGSEVLRLTATAKMKGHLQRVRSESEPQALIRITSI